RENYDSVVAMQKLNEALERIDSSFQFALAGEEDKARRQYAAHWPEYDAALDVERRNVTLPGERELVDELERLSRRYRELGDDFYKLPTKDPRRRELYFQGGLFETFTEVKNVSGRILDINQDNMKAADRDARKTAADSLLYFGLGLGV